MTPYARSKQALEAEGYIVGKTEHWNSFAYVRQDLFGIIDMVCIRAGNKGVLGVQPTTGDHVADHLRKALAEPRLFVWLQAGNRFSIHGWRKVGERGKRKIWDCRIVPVLLEDFSLSPGNTA